MTERKNRTYPLKPKVIKKTDDVAEELDVNKNIIVERALMYYFRDYDNDELRDPWMNNKKEMAEIEEKDNSLGLL